MDKQLDLLHGVLIDVFGVVDFVDDALLLHLGVIVSFLALLATLLSFSFLRRHFCFTTSTDSYKRK